ncbi:MAG: hypothetical protein KC618_08830 [Candidatus Omnitrophica bacterium]|nr:hypothetical protein [Candidatus Omnitrophota bacterium]
MEIRKKLRNVLWVMVSLTVISCGVVQPYISVPPGQPRAQVNLLKNNEYLELQVYMFEPDENCKFHYQGTTFLEKKETSKAIYVSPGRRYFRVSGRYTAPGQSSFTDILDKSFVLDSNRQYQIYLEQVPTKRYRRFAYNIHFLDITDTEPQAVDTDDFAICEELK